MTAAPLKELETLLKMVSDIAEPAEAIRAQALEIVKKGQVSEPTRTALFNLHAALNNAFFEAGQVLRNRKLDEYEANRDRSL